MKHKALWGITVFAMATARGAAPSSEVPINTFKGPKMEHMEFNYPIAARRARQSGWVVLGFMVSSKGRPYAVTVLNSTGVKVLEDAAIDDLENSMFVPASLDGKPIDSGDEVQYKYVLIPTQIRKDFYSNYTHLLHAVEKMDEKAANHFLNVTEPENLAEDALYAIARARYAAIWGSPSEELSDLERADLDNNAVNSLPSDLVRSERLIKLALDINLHHYVEALAAWKELKPPSLPRDVSARLAPAIAQIEHIRDAQLGFSITGQIRATSWTLGLLEPQFSIIVSEGRISEVRLGCQRGYVYFPFNPTLQYTVNTNYGTCKLTLVGDPGTRFTLNQF